MTAEDHAFSVLDAVAGLPTAPLHEEAVARYLVAALRPYGFAVRTDQFGNILAHYRRGHEARPLALVAHMDHPGFVVTRMSGHEALVDVLGGIPAGVLAPGTVLRFHAGAESYVGAVREYLPAVGRLRPAVRVDVAGNLAAGIFGVLDIPSCTRIDRFLALRAADDLAQCACLLLVAERLAAVADPVDVTFVFTRAEEIGLVGATLLAQSSLLSHDTIVVSLECSRTLPGAEIGQGPVIRVGDLGQSFDPRGEALLLAARDQLVQRQASAAAPTRVQRQLMTGGSCEAASFLAHGYITTGLVLPLGNYHNADARGLLAPEYVHMDDLLGAIDLLLAAIAETSHPLPDRHERLRGLAERSSAALIETAALWDLGQPTAAAAAE